jgi:beta-galactosidase GanA
MDSGNFIRKAAFALILTFFISGFVSGQENLPALVTKDGRHTLIVDGKPFFMLGGQAHNSSAWPKMMPCVWAAIDALHANTLEVPVYWEQIEAQPGNFNFSLVDTLLFQAREKNVHLVFLWFATWKNGSNHYMPEWMKKDSKKYPNITGAKGNPVDSPSPHTQAAMEADAKAFTAFMTYLKQNDPHHTVIMVQVENEPGSWGSVRDYSTAAEKIFQGPVPAELLKPEVLKSLNKNVVTKGTWKEVFGDDADEYFQAWHVARYINYVAAAGKKVYPLPLYVNAALKDPLTNPAASTYESGGPTDNVIPVWKAAAPSIDLVAPDIYLQGSERVLKVLDLYGRADNPLFVPETGASPENVKYLYTVLSMGGLGFSPFGIDDNGRGETQEETQNRLGALGQEYALLNKMNEDIAKWAFEGKVISVVEKEDHAEQTIDLGNWQAVVSFSSSTGRNAQQNSRPIGKAMIIRFGENEFMLTGTQCHFTFKPTGKNEGKSWQYLKVEEGEYKNGAFSEKRILNGDETDWGGPRIGNTPILLHTTLITR